MNGSKHPNFVFILADDLGYADLGCTGAHIPPGADGTPRLDRMAAEGLLFSDGYSNSCVCSPTRFALITGRYQYRIPAAAEEPLASNRARGQEGMGLDPAHPTMPSLLRNAGLAGVLKRSATRANLVNAMQIASERGWTVAESHDKRAGQMERIRLELETDGGVTVVEGGLVLGKPLGVGVMISYVWTAFTLLYLAMRRVCDGQDMNEIWTERMIPGTLGEMPGFLHTPRAGDAISDTGPADDS